MSTYRGRAGRKRRLLWGLLPLVLLGAGAWYLSRPALEANLKEKAEAALKSAGAKWAKVSVEGRDAILSGVAPSESARNAARRTVLHVRGIRRVTAGDLKISPLGAPTVDKALATKAPVAISGTWKPLPGATLVIEVAGKRYELGKAPALKAEGGKWTLTLAELPADGAHDVVAIVTVDGREARDATTGELTVDATPPAEPTFEGAELKDGRWLLSGSWPEKDAAGLVVKVDDRLFTLGKAKELTTDGKGHWRLALPAAGLKEGPHEVAVAVADAAGNTATKSWPKAFTVDATPPAPAAFTALVANDPHAVISGTWPSDDAKSLDVELDGEKHVLGESPRLKVAGDRWVLTTDAPLKPGTHKLWMRVADAAGNARESTASFEVKSKPEPAPQPAPQPAPEPTRAPAPTAHPPVIDALLANNPRAVISGTWPGEKEAKSLEVELDGRKFVMGQTDALKVEGKVWKLYPPAPLSEGRHHVVARVIDAAGHAASANREVVIDTTPPDVPRVDGVTVKTGEKPMLTGTLPADVTAMKMTVDGKTWELGAEGSALVKTDGSWKLALPEALPEGRHDVTVVVGDEAGNTTQETFAGAIVVLPAQEAQPQPASQPVADVEKCQRDINAFLKDHHIRFETDSDLLTSEGIAVVARLANLIRKCPGLRFHIVGHTDNRGNFQHNKELSARRAQTVKNALVGAGITADRLTTEGAGPTFPIASNATEEGRALNRRIEVKVLKPE